MSIDAIKAKILAILPPDGLGLLRAIFLQTETRSKGISADRFRADNYKYIRSIEQLERYFISRTHDNVQRQQIYRLNRIALPVIDNDDSEELLQRMNKLLPYLAEQYGKNLTHLVLLKDMLKFLGGRNRGLSLEAVLYLSGCQGFSGETHGFPLNEDAGIFVSERILESATIEDVLEYDLQWIGAGQQRIVAPILVDDIIGSSSVGAVGAAQLSLAALELNPNILDAAAELFQDGHHWEAVFAASKVLVNLVKEKSGRKDLDGAALMRTVFSVKNPILAFNGVSSQIEKDEQEGMMHLFEGTILAIRNQGAHSFPEGEARRAVEYLVLISLLAYRVQDAENIEKPF